MEYFARAQRYAARVLSGEQIAGKWVKAACKRFQDDLERAEAGSRYRFDETAADRACIFLELMPHIEGKWATTHIVLEDWQVFIVCNLFGWLRQDNGMRRFRRFYLEVARKNGKSPMAAGILLYLTFADGEPGAQVYSFATGKDQAKIVWKTAREMVRKEPDFANLGAAYNMQAIFSVHTASTFKPLAKNYGSLDGLNTHGFLADELHAHKDRGLWDVMDSSTGARSQPLGGAITTAGSNTAGICYERRGYLTKILNSVLLRHDGMGYPVKGDAVDDDTVFGVIYTVDDEDQDDPFNEAHWVKANPNLGVSVSIDDMRAQAQLASVMASAVNEFLTKRLNVWVNGESPWMDMRAWERCADKTLQLSDFAGEPCWMGLDLAQKKDFAALCLVFQREGMWTVFTRLYLNELAVQESGNAHLSGWARSGHVQVTDGDITDFDIVAEDLRSYCRQFDVQEIAFDPALSMYFAGKLIEEGLPLVEITQRAMFFTPALIQVENMVLEKKLKFDGNPVMTWMVSNLVVKVSKFNELRSPTKERPENKIDGPMAMLMALGRALATEPKSTSFWEVLDPTQQTDYSGALQ